MFNADFLRRRIAWLALALALLAPMIQSDVWTQAQEKETGVNVKGNKVELKEGYKFGGVSDNKVEVRRVSDNRMVSAVQCGSCPFPPHVSCRPRVIGRTLICESNTCADENCDRFTIVTP